MSSKILLVGLTAWSVAMADKGVPGPEAILQTAGFQSAQYCTTETLLNKNPFVREAAATICGKLRVRTYLKELTNILQQDDYVYARIAAGTSLIVLGVQTAEQPLLALASREVPLAWDIAGSLAAAGRNDLALKVATDAMPRTHEPKELNRAILAFEAFAPGDAAPRALERLGEIYRSSKDQIVRLRVLEAIEKFPATRQKRDLMSGLLSEETDSVARSRLEGLLQRQERPK